MGHPAFIVKVSVMETVLGVPLFWSPGNVALMSALAGNVCTGPREQTATSSVINLNHFSRVLPVNGYKLLESTREGTIPG